MPFTCSRSRQPWLACTSTPTVEPSTTREAVPIPPLKPWHCMPVPLPTPPSATEPPDADSSAAWTCSARTCIPLMSFRSPSYVSPTTGRYQRCSPGASFCTAAVISASRTTPTEWVFVEPDDGRQEAGLTDPLEAGQLAVPVQPVAAGEGGLGPGVVGAGHDDGDAGAHRAASDDQRAVAVDEGRVADADAGDIGDRVGLSRREAADDDPEVAGPLSGRGYVRPPSWRGRPSSGIGSQTAAVATW